MCSICVGIKTGNILSGENQVVSFKNMNFQFLGFRHFGRLKLLPFDVALCYVTSFAADICLYFLGHSASLIPGLIFGTLNSTQSMS